MNPRMDKTLGRARGLMSGFTTGQKAVVAVAIVALIMGAVALSQWATQPSWTPLYSDLSGADANAVVEELNSQGVEHKLADGGGTVLVPQNKVYDLRVALAGKGLPAAEGDSYSVLDEQGMTATDFQQNIAYRRALESELGKTLEAIAGVQTAIVHVAIPEPDVFATQDSKPTSSVLLAMAPGTTLTTEQVRSITHLVSHSVENLTPDNVTVTDGQGRLLSSTQTGAEGAASTAGEADQRTAQFENRLNDKVQKMLDTVLGTGRAVIRVNATLNYDTQDTTSERYVQENGVNPLSESTTTETYTGAGGNAGGVLGRTWPDLTAAAAGQGTGDYSREERTVNNSVGKVVARTQAAPGAVERLSVAVVLDSRVNGQEQAAAVTPQQVEALVSNAVGLEAARGDSVQVTSVPFDQTTTQAAQKELAEAAAAARTRGYVDLGTKVALVLAVLIVLLAIRRRRRKAAKAAAEAERIRAVASDLPRSFMDENALSAEQRQLLAVLPDLPPTGAATSMPDGQPNPAIEREKLRQEVTQLVDSQPDEVAQVIQGWLSQRKG
ncbi:MAG: flagellar M-ring protein FliF [Actinomycetota bacterium]|nr:flagellar M-ring protein FliF [Actinomycetota bacterium]